jgi:PD-(D/E)XK endonuclease
VLSTDQKGAIAETAIIHEATKLGIRVYKPVSDGTRYDLIFDLGDELVRVQCKWARRYGDVIAVRCYSCRRSRDGLLRRAYTADEVDAFAAYCAAVDRCYFIRIAELRGSSWIQLRLVPTRNNQDKGVNWADAHEFAATLGTPGAVAQLGEHSAGSRKVTGSNPVGSIA